jgi:hypothetical protein
MVQRSALTMIAMSEEGDLSMVTMVERRRREKRGTGVLIAVM